jgi:alpha,alpha-trehalase
MKTSMNILERNSIDTIILDLDGVITDTASLHEQAWKQTFDALLQELSQKTDQPFHPFTHNDYLEHLDGKPRFQGAQDFLHSRDIDLPAGYHDDPSGFYTISSIANHKDWLYFQFIDTQGVSVFPDARTMLIKWKIQGFKLALISSSKSCRYITDRAGLSAVFDTIVDGNDLITMKIKGKPHPDMLLYAAEKTGMSYARTAIIEDAVSGIEAGKKGNFAIIIGVARTGSAQLLLDNGADRVVFSLKELSVQPPLRNISEIPSFNGLMEDFFPTIPLKKCTIFLDYDGTLTPIVRRPEDAKLPSQSKDMLEQLSKKFTVGIISGRDRTEIQSLVNISSLYYAGNHGFDIAGPGNCSFIHPSAKIVQPYLSRAELYISESLSSINGILIERKQFSIAVHYRLVNPADVEMIRKELALICDVIKGLKISSGKKVFELQPDIEWNKGTAVLWLIEKLYPIASLSPNTTFVYIGDDITDEDAFREIADIGISILVGSHGSMTSAKYHLDSVAQVYNLIEMLLSLK